MNNVWRQAQFRRDHRWAPLRMSDYLDGELAARGRRRLERHVRDCEECRAVLRGLTQMLEKLHAVHVPGGRPEPRELAARVRERLREHPER